MIAFNIYVCLIVNTSQPLTRVNSTATRAPMALVIASYLAKINRFGRLPDIGQTIGGKKLRYTIKNGGYDITFGRVDGKNSNPRYIGGRNNRNTITGGFKRKLHVPGIVIIDRTSMHVMHI